MVAYLVQLVFHVGKPRDAEVRLAGKAGACGVGAHLLRIIGREKQLAIGCEVQRRMAADGAHHLHARALAVGAFHIDDFIALAHAEADRLLDLLVQLAHGNQGRFAHAQAGLDQVAQLQETHAQPVAARFGAVDEAADGQVVENAVRGGGCRPVRSLISLSDTASSREANTSINVNMRSRTWTLGLGEAALSSFFMRRKGISGFGHSSGGHGLAAYVPPANSGHVHKKCR